jgi:hybrid cluster-associated redox disulfide protein
MTMTIDAGCRLRDLLREHPEARKALAASGMLCPACRGMEHETLGHAAVNHGIPISRLLAEIEAALKPGP